MRGKPYRPKRRGNSRAASSREPKGVAAPDWNRLPDVSGLPRVIVNPAESHTPRVRPVWLYDTMVVDESEARESGADSVALMDVRGRFFGSAVYNPSSKIRARVFSLRPCRFDESYL